MFVCIYIYLHMYVNIYGVSTFFSHSNPSKSTKPTLAPQPLHLSAASALDQTSLGMG